MLDANIEFVKGSLNLNANSCYNPSGNELRGDSFPDFVKSFVLSYFVTVGSSKRWCELGNFETLIWDNDLICESGISDFRPLFQ